MSADWYSFSWTRAIERTRWVTSWRTARMAASGNRSACKATRLEMTCMLFFTR